MEPLEEHLPYAIRQFDTSILVPLRVFGIDISITDVTLAKAITATLIVAYMLFALRQRSLIPGRLQASVEALYLFVASTVTRLTGEEGRSSIPFLFTVFCFVLFGTLLGLMPFKETFMSHLATALALSFLVFTYIHVVAFRRRGLGFFSAFLPANVPLFVYPILIPVEIISYLFRPITLGFRIFANIFAGHVMVKLFADFCVMLIEAIGPAGIAASVAPLVVMTMLFGFEIGIVCIQSYIFLLISTMYLRDALKEH
ncbi:F0F1 ATP synthase subunit A [bacterium]|nr:F0F1 ATP synthase subunit A [bacterium]